MGRRLTLWPALENGGGTTLIIPAESVQALLDYMARLTVTQGAGLG